MRGIKTLEELNIKDNRVILRVDYNVPMTNGSIIDDERIKRGIPTIKKLLEKGAKSICIISHLGRPGGNYTPALSLKPIADHLSKLLNMPVNLSLIDDFNYEAKIVMLENIRFWKGEEKNDPEFSKRIAQFGEIYINDAFSVSHREHASIVGVPLYVKEKGIGYLFHNEYKNLKRLIENPERPFIAIIGGKKARDKIGVIKKLSTKVDKILIGGGLTFTFLKASNKEIGKSVCDYEYLDETKKLMESINNIELPEDVVVVDDISTHKIIKTVDINSIPENWYGVDIGPKTLIKYQRIIKDAKTIFWAGPMGIFEIEEFARGTRSMAEYISERTKQGLFSYIGGGDTIASIKHLGFSGKFSYESISGGAALHFIEKGTLPGIEILRG